MRNERPIHRVKEIDSYAWKIITALSIVLLTVVGVFDAQFDKIDKWADTIEGQLVIARIAGFVIGCFGVKWFVNKIKN